MVKVSALVMKVTVFPDTEQDRIEALVLGAPGHRGGPRDLALVVEHVAAGWRVHATGLNDPVLERGFADVVEAALRRADL
jgi:hypothetical protein